MSADSSRDRKWRSAIHRNDLGTIKRLYKKGYNPNKCTVSQDGTANNKYIPAVVFASVSDDRLPVLETLHDSCNVGVVNVRSDEGNALVHIAAQHGALEVLKKLVGWGADLHAVYGKDDTSVAHDAAQHGQTLVLRWLFETYPVFLNKKLLNGFTPACAALLHKQKDALKVCIDFGYDLNEPIFCPGGYNPNGTITLHDMAASIGNDKMAKWLRNNGAKVTSESVNFARLGAVLPLAVREGKADIDHVSMKKILDEANAPISRTKECLAKKILFIVCDYCGDSKPGVPLQCCQACRMVGYCGRSCQKNHWIAHKPLCKAHKRGEEVKWPDANLALRLKCAIQEGDLNLIKHLVTIERFNLEGPMNKSIVNEQIPPMTALQFAASGKRVPIPHAKKTVKLLVESGANLETKVSGSGYAAGYTALFMAQNVRDVEMMMLLRDLGADINARDCNRQTLLHAVAYTDTPEDIEIARMIVSWEGFDLDAQDVKGFTALGWAKGKGNPKMAKLLEEHGVSGGVDLDDTMTQLNEMIQLIESGKMSLASVGLDAQSYNMLKQQASMRS